MSLQVYKEEDQQSQDNALEKRVTTELNSQQSVVEHRNDLTEEHKLSAADIIMHHLAEIKEMIAFLDYSFERAFTMKEKGYIRDYKEHVVQIQTELDAMRIETFDKNLLEATKQKKIRQFQEQLKKIKESALFMGEISELHSQALKQKHRQVKDLEFDLRFCEDMIHKEKLRSNKLKQELSEASNQYDELYKQVKSYIDRNQNDITRITELVAMLDDEHKKEIKSQYPHLFNQDTKKTNDEASFDWTAQSFKRFSHVKIQNFLQQMRGLGLSDKVIARQVDNYFRMYQAPRKQSQIDNLKEQISKEKAFGKQISEQKVGILDPAKTNNVLQAIFLEYVAKVKDQIQQRIVQKKIDNSRSTRLQASQSLYSSGPVLLSDFKSHDKRNLMERFFSDARVVRILAAVFKNQPLPEIEYSKPQTPQTNFGLIKPGQSLRSSHFNNTQKVVQHKHTAALVPMTPVKTINDEFQLEKQKLQNNRPQTQGAAQRHTRIKNIQQVQLQKPTYQSQPKQEFTIQEIQSYVHSGGVTTEVGSKTNKQSSQIQSFPQPQPIKIQ